MFFKRLLVTPIIISLVVGNFLPTLAQAASVKNTKGVLSVSSTSSNLPETDWSAVDWEQEVVLPQDFTAYQKKADEYFRKVVAKVKGLVQDTLKKWEVAGFN